MTPTFRSSFFALLETYAPIPSRTGSPHTEPKAAHIGSRAGWIFGVLGQNDWFADTDYSAIRASVRRALADPASRLWTL